MTETDKYNAVTPRQVQILQEQGCIADNWDKVYISSGADLSMIRNTSFITPVRIGDIAGTVADADGNNKPCGIYDSIINDCTIGDNCRISGIKVQIANYDIADRVCIEDAGKIECSGKSAFGNGVIANVINEAGGREITLFEGLSAQFAYILSTYRYRPEITEKLKSIAKLHINEFSSDRGVIQTDAKICSCRRIQNVRVGASAIINGASSLVNGTVNSSSESPAVIGDDVIAKDFIISSAASVLSGSVIERVFVGQGTKIAKHFIAEDSVFFANCEAVAGEACAVFAGPHTVTHHKSTLLIAGLFSFFNAGSATNQSNHMYRLGPVHEGKMLRGAKTGSFAYMLWPSVAGAYSVVLGKHSKRFDAGCYPFSRIYAESGQTFIEPAAVLTGCGIVRDRAKWPKRDKRPRDKLDAVSFEVFSPYTISMMQSACERLEKLDDETDRSFDKIEHGSAFIIRRQALKAIDTYNKTIKLYLLEKLFERLFENAGLDKDPDAVYCDNWADVGGLLMPSKRLEDMLEDIEQGRITSIEKFNSAVTRIHGYYDIDEWAYVANKLTEVFDIDLSSLYEDKVRQLGRLLIDLKTWFVQSVIEDAQRDFSAQSRIGFGIDGQNPDIEKDFRMVRGEFEDNPFVSELKQELQTLKDRINRLVV